MEIAKKIFFVPCTHVYFCCKFGHFNEGFLGLTPFWSQSEVESWFSLSAPLFQTTNPIPKEIQVKKLTGKLQ